MHDTGPTPEQCMRNAFVAAFERAIGASVSLFFLNEEPRAMKPWMFAVALWAVLLCIGAALVWRSRKPKPKSLAERFAEANPGREFTAMAGGKTVYHQPGSSDLGIGIAVQDRNPVPVHGAIEQVSTPAFVGCTADVCRCACANLDTPVGCDNYQPRAAKGIAVPADHVPPSHWCDKHGESFDTCPCHRG